MSQIQVDPGELASIAHADLSNAFYKMRMPESLHERFSLPAIAAGYLPSSLGAGHRFDTLLTPILITPAHGMELVTVLLSVSCREPGRR